MKNNKNSSIEQAFNQAIKYHGNKQLKLAEKIYIEIIKLSKN